MHTKFKHHITYSPSPAEEKASQVKRLEALYWKHLHRKPALHQP
jgi:hypothetical protein